MVQSWGMVFFETALAIAVTLSTLLSVILFVLPKPFDPTKERTISEDDFSADDKQNASASGYGYFLRRRGTGKPVELATSVVVLVLGDIGRSPRMQYHATSIAAHGGSVDLVGYLESDVLPEIRASRLINIVPLTPVPAKLQTRSKALFPFMAPLKVIYQICNLYYTLGYKIKADRFMLVQNPPSIPTLLVAQLICYTRHTRLIIDWHNLGHTILALKLGYGHPLVKLSEAYETVVARFAHGHFAVSQAMTKLLKQKYGIDAQPLYDRPAKQFRPLSAPERSRILAALPQTAKHAKDIENGTRKLLVSSTSWTPDEDFSILLDALVVYSATASMSKKYPKIIAIITGKGPLKHYYMDKIHKLHQEKRLSNVQIHTAWLSMEDYAALLGSADMGVSLHTSSSGVDLSLIHISEPTRPY